MDTHRHGTLSYNLAFAIGIFLNVGFVIAEVVFGILAGSMALLADAGHNLSDVLGLFLAWGAGYLSKLQPTQRKTYGWRSTTIMAALLNAIILLVAIGGIVWESIRRLSNPSPVAGKSIIAVAAIGLIINTVTALLFRADRKKDLNIRGAFLHMAADAGVSAGVVVTGFIILSTGWLWVDPVVSLTIAVIIMIGTWGLLQESINLTLHGVPVGINTQYVFDYFQRLPGVKAVHDLHIWAMSTTETALTVHIVKPESEDDDVFIARVRKELHEQFGIEHITLQFERNETSLPCTNGCELKDIEGGCK